MEIIKTDKAPVAIGPYVQGVKSGGFIFCSGQLALMADGTFVDGDIKAQAVQVMENLKAILEASGSSFAKAVKCTIYLVDINDFVLVNEVYAGYFPVEIKPARATVAVAALPKGARLEIDCVAEI